ncbi:MAG TPA: sugar ABC transporter permease [Symbiobacteriaceae bacterium]|nr:sugar ABC transporter permease [Symbiobacteriaceae bacterium]
MALRTSIARGLNLPEGATRAGWRRFWRETSLAYTLLLPALIVLGLFSFYPVLRALQLSLLDWDMISESSTFVGLANYRELLHDPLFWKAVKNTLIYIIGTVPIEIALALGVAMLLNQKLKGIGFYRLAFFLPHVTTVVAISMVWAWIYHDQYGLLNTMLGWFGIPGQKWLLDPKWTMFTIILMSVWKTLGYTAVIFLAGLQGLDKQLQEAATVDGANRWQTFRHVSWPLLSPTTFFVSITSVIGAFKVFSEIFVLYGGQPGPLREGITIVFYIYEKAWSEYRMGYASAAAYVLFFMVLAVTFFQLWYGKRRVHYD